MTQKNLDSSIKSIKHEEQKCLNSNQRKECPVEHKVINEINSTCKAQDTLKIKINKHYSKKKYLYSQQSNSYERHVWVTSILPYKYRKLKSPNNLSKKYYFYNKKKISHCYDSNTLSIDKDKPSHSKSISKTNSLLSQNVKNTSSSNDLPYLKIQKRYVDILQEVKKILQKDIISKRKLKYIFKKQQLPNHILIEKLHSHSKDVDYCRTKFEKKQNYDKTHVEVTNLRLSQSTLDVQPTERFSKNFKYYNNFENAAVTYNKFSKNLHQNKSSLNPELYTQSNIRSRSPSPALPLTREEALLNQSFKNVSNQQSFITKLEVSNESDFDLQLKNNLNCMTDNSEHLDLQHRFLLISKSSESNLLANTITCENSKDLILVNKNLNFEDNSSLYQLSLKSSSSQCYSPNYLIQHNCLKSITNEDKKFFKNNKLTASSLKSSKTLSSEISKSKTPVTTRFSHNSEENFTSRNSSTSITNVIYNLSPSLPKNSNVLIKRCGSKDSTLTPSSSTKYSRINYSCSSRSTSSVSYRTSRPASSDFSRSRSPSIPRRYGSPSFLDRRRITSARKRPVPYHRSTPSPSSTQSSVKSSKCSSWSSKSCRSSQSQSCSSSLIIDQKYL